MNKRLNRSQPQRLIVNSQAKGTFLKVDKYDGTTSFEAFMCQFDRSANYNNWGE